MLRTLYNDENGFILSAELVLISTMLITGLVVGLSSIQNALVGELNDVGKSIGNMNQSYSYTGFSTGQSNSKFGGGGDSRSMTSGSSFNDHADDADNQYDIACDWPVSESSKY